MAGSSVTCFVIGERRPEDVLAQLGSRRRAAAKLDAAIAKRRRALERPAERCTEPRPPKPHQVLAAALAGGRITAERVAEALAARPEDVAPIAAGRVGLAETAWKRLLREIAGRGRQASGDLRAST